MFAYARTLVGNCAFTMTHGRLVRSELAVPVGYDPGTTHPLRPPACPAVCLSTSVCSLRRSSARLFDCLFGYLVVRPPACLPVCPVIGLSVHLAVHLYARSPVCTACLFTCLSRCLFLRPLVCILVCSPLVCSAACLSTHLFIFIYISIYIYIYVYIYIYI